MSSLKTAAALLDEIYSPARVVIFPVGVDPGDPGVKSDLAVLNAS